MHQAPHIMPRISVLSKVRECEWSQERERESGVVDSYILVILAIYYCTFCKLLIELRLKNCFIILCTTFIYASLSSPDVHTHTHVYTGHIIKFFAISNGSNKTVVYFYITDIGWL